MLKFAGSLLLLISLFSIISPPRLLGTRGRAKAAIGALLGCVLLIVSDHRLVPSVAEQQRPADATDGGLQEPAAASSPVKAMLGRSNSLFLEIRNTRNVYCAADGPFWVVGEINGEFVALNGLARNWSQKQHLSVYSDGKWTLVADRGAKPFGFSVGALIDIGNRMCPSPSNNIVEAAFSRVKEGEKRFASRAAEFGLAGGPDQKLVRSEPRQTSPASLSSDANGLKPSAGFIDCARRWPNKLQRYNCLINQEDLGGAERCRNIPSFDEKVSCFDQFTADVEVAQPQRKEQEAPRDVEVARQPQPKAQEAVRDTCGHFQQRFTEAQRQFGFENRFVLPVFDVTRVVKGRTVSSAVNIPATEFHVECNELGEAVNIAIAGLGARDEEFNRTLAVMVAAMAVVSEGKYGRDVGDVWHRLYSRAEKDQRNMRRATDYPVGTALDRLGSFDARLMVLPSRAFVLEASMGSRPYMSELLKRDWRDIGEVRSSEATHWRCDPSDPDGIGGMGGRNVGNVTPPALKRGECIIAAQPHHLIRSPFHLVDRVIEMSRMGCYRHDLDDYRCVPFRAHIRSGSNGLVVIAAAIADAQVQQHIDRYCPTLRRGLESKECMFIISFKALKFDTDHMETIRIVRTDEIAVHQ